MPSAPTVPVTPTPTPKDDCGFTDVVCKVSKAVREALSTGIGWGVQGIVNLVVQGEVVLLSWLAKLIFTHTAIGAPNEAFYTVYNSIAGYLIILVFVFFLLSTIINGLRISGPGPLSTLGGLVRAMLGISFAGGIAFVIVQAWDTATNGLIDANSSQPWDPSILVKSITVLSNGAGTAFLALCIGVLSIFGLLLLFIMLLFRSLLTTGAALLGAMAMTGQVMPETRHWGRRWFWTVNALASSKFFIAALWIYGSRTAYEADSLIACLQGLLIIWLMVFTPGILMRLTTMWDGYLSDVNARAVVSTPGSASDIGEGIGREFARQSANSGDSGDSGGGGDAADQMSHGASDIATTPGQDTNSGQDTSDALDGAETDTEGAPTGEDDPAAGAENSDEGVGDPAAEGAEGSEADAGSPQTAETPGDADETTSNSAQTPGDTAGSSDPASGSGEVKGGDTAAQAEAGADGAAQGVAQQAGDESAVGAPAGGSDAASGSPGATTAGGVSPGGDQAGAPTSSGPGGQPGAGGADGGSASGGAGPNTGGSGADGANSSGGSSPGGGAGGAKASGGSAGGGSAGGAGAGAGVEDVAIVAL